MPACLAAIPLAFAGMTWFRMSEYYFRRHKAANLVTHDIEYQRVNLMVIEKKKKIDAKKIFSGPGLSLIYVIVFSIIVLGTIMYGSFYHSGNLTEGDISLRTVYAPYDFRYPWGINEKETQTARKRVLKEVPLVLEIDYMREEAVIRNLTVFFDGLDDVKNAGNRQKQKETIEDLKIRSGIDVSSLVVSYLADRDDKEAIRVGIIDIITSVYPLGIVDADEIAKDSPDITFVKIINGRIKTERVRPFSDVITVKKANNICKEYAARIFPRDSRLKNYCLDLVEELITPNAVMDKEETERLKEQTIKSTPVIHNMRGVKKNEIIFERGKRITGEHIAQMIQLGLVGSATRRGPYLVGMLLFIVLLILLCIGAMFIIEGKLVNVPKDVIMVLLNSLFVILLGQFIIQSPQSSYIIPLAGSAMLITLLVGPRVALLATIIVSLFLGVIAGGKVDVTLVLLIGGCAGAYLVRDARRRSRILLAGLAAGVASSLMIISISLINNLEAQVYLNDALWGLLSGFLSVFLVMGALPLFEYAFKVTTNITLLELSDLNYPLLKELTLKAPGTYQHSIMVGNLAEVACDAIGANSLLARVGSYYHDIGKLGQAEYFSENQMGARSKHEKLMPSMSALIIVNHVKDGVELARKHKLNPKIIEFINQHHGSGLIYYFYQRALEKSGHDNTLNEEEFRYPGPRPQSKEAAIVLLADSVEASSRALSDPTPARIRGLVQKIINNKFIDNQLDECELTLKDLNKIAASFARVLTAVFHTRLEYPDRKDIEAAKKTNDKSKHQQYKQK